MINVVDGKRLGVICDLDLDLENGRITALIVPGASRFFSMFGGNRDFVIPWENIVKIGVDTILVDLPGPIYRNR